MIFICIWLYCSVKRGSDCKIPVNVCYVKRSFSSQRTIRWHFKEKNILRKLLRKFRRTSKKQSCPFAIDPSKVIKIKTLRKPGIGKFVNLKFQISQCMAIVIFIPFVIPHILSVFFCFIYIYLKDMFMMQYQPRDPFVNLENGFQFRRTGT